jgi:hypothetical protein
MKRSFIEITFYETYYFANVVREILEDRSSYLRVLNEFYGDDQYLHYTSPFPKFSAFHSFIRFVIDDVISDDVNAVKLDVLQDDFANFQNTPDALHPHPPKLPVNLAMDRLGIQHQTFDGWLQENGRTFLDARDEDMAEYYDHLREEGQFDQLLDQATAEVFFVLFQNRNVLLLFNDMMAAEVRRSADGPTEEPTSSVFARPGVLRRAPIPKWVQRAVFYRDRGLCILCHQDLTGLLSIWSEENYDHIVPLAEGALNDVTNIQLLCRACNSKKRAGKPTTSNRYEAWYEMED